MHSAIVYACIPTSLTSTHTPTHTLTHTLTAPRRLQCVGGVRTKRNIEMNKQWENFTIPAKIFCRVQESMQETGQQRRKRIERKQREEREKSRRQSGEKRERKRAVRA